MRLEGSPFALDVSFVGIAHRREVLELLSVAILLAATSASILDLLNALSVAILSASISAATLDLLRAASVAIYASTLDLLLGRRRGEIF